MQEKEKLRTPAKKERKKDSQLAMFRKQASKQPAKGKLRSVYLSVCLCVRVSMSVCPFASMYSLQNGREAKKQEEKES